MAAHQSPPCLGFSRQEHWSGLPFPSPMHDVANFDVFPSFFIMCKVFGHLSCSLQKKLPAFLHFVLASCTSSHNFVLTIPFDLEHLSSTLNCLLPQQVTGLKFKASLKLCPVCSRLRLPRAPASQDPSAVPRVQNG